MVFRNESIRSLWYAESGQTISRATTTLHVVMDDLLVLGLVIRDEAVVNKTNWQ